MNDKEKKAIENVKRNMQYWRKYMPEDKSEHPEDILLNLIQKQEKEIKKLKFKNEIYKKKAKIDEKVIDEMIPIIYDYSNLGYLGICPAELENGCLNLGECKYFPKQSINCLKCIKQYFYRKVEEDEMQ